MVGCHAQTRVCCYYCKIRICEAHSTTAAWQSHYNQPNCAAGSSYDDAHSQKLGQVRATLAREQWNRLNWTTVLEVDGVDISRVGFSQTPFRELQEFHGMEPTDITAWLNKNRPLGGSNFWHVKSYSGNRLVVACDRGRKPEKSSRYVTNIRWH